jgi:hypothetical protein
MSFGDLCIVWFFMLVVVFMGIKKMLKNAAKNEGVRNAVKKGAVSLFWRLWK